MNKKQIYYREPRYMYGLWLMTIGTSLLFDKKFLYIFLIFCLLAIVIIQNESKPTK